MKFDSLRDYIDAIKQLGELKVINNANWDLEIGALTELTAEKRGPVLLFDRIEGYPPGFRVVTNSFATSRRTALVHGLPGELTPFEMLKAWREKLRGFKPVPPAVVNKGPVQENIVTGKDVDLFKFPAPKWHELDGGRYLGTGCCVITRDPDEGWINVGTYRCMIQNKNTIFVKAVIGKHGRIMMNKYHARGKSCPIALTFGQDPALYAAACDMTIRWGASEYDFAGWMRGAPIDVVTGAVTGLPIPATAEIAIEGEIPPPPFAPTDEGPFGEWTGYYSGVAHGTEPLMTVKSILYRNDPIILGEPELKPPTPCHFAMPRNAVGVWDQLERADIPGIKGVWFLTGSINPDVLVIAIKQQYAGQAKQAAVVGAGCRAGSLGGRVVIVVDDDIDITNAQEVMWAVASRSRAEDAEIIRDLWTTPADPMIDKTDRDQNLSISSRLIINACRPWNRIKDFPPVNRVSQEYRDQILRKWSQVL